MSGICSLGKILLIGSLEAEKEKLVQLLRVDEEDIVSVSTKKEASDFLSKEQFSFVWINFRSAAVILKMLRNSDFNQKTPRFCWSASPSLDFCQVGLDDFSHFEAPTQKTTEQVIRELAAKYHFPLR